MSMSHSHHGGCAPCHNTHGDCDHSHDCSEDDVIFDELIEDSHRFTRCIHVRGDHVMDDDEEIVLVFRPRTPPVTPRLSEITLACPDNLDSCFPITVVAVDEAVIVRGLRNEPRGGTGLVTIPAGSTATFRAIEPPCECAFYLACVCSPPL